jgi:alpha-mannosidase
MRFHLLANSHLDPVWLWDWREGLNEGITTCRTVLQLMAEWPELTYLRGESSVYAHIERHDPATFARIREMIDTGRWDVVGGTVCQPDTNLPATEVLCRQFTNGLDYFRRSFGVRPTVAWAADSFGHSRGWPEIYAAAGMTGLAFTRPFQSDCDLPGPAFWWVGSSGQRVLCWRVPIGWYGSERGEVAARLDAYREQAAKWGLDDVAIFFGLGNHGGGPTRRQLRDIDQWRQANRDVTTEFSTLHRFFRALRSQSAALPVVDRELNFTLRGCYASAARFKFAYRHTENMLLRAERTATAIAAAGHAPTPTLAPAWDALLFNSFHDILPGSSIERAYQDQHATLGVTYHAAQAAELTALNVLAATLDTRVPIPEGDLPSAVPVMLWNPHPHAFAGQVEFEAALDYRPIASYRNRPDELPVAVRDPAGRRLPFQLIATEHHFATELPWRKRFVMPVTLPPLGWKLVTVAWDEAASPPPAPKHPAHAVGVDGITNGPISVQARAGAAGVALQLDGRSWFGRGGLGIASFADPFGSWGGHDGEREADDISQVLHTWKVERVKVLESGPWRAALWVHLAGGASRLDLTFFLERGERQVRVAARLFWAERAARLKLILPGAEQAEFEVPGGTVERGPSGEVPGGRWVRVRNNSSPWSLASDALYNFDLKDGALRATVVRSTRPAWNAPSQPDDEPWRPHLDLGEHRFQFALGAADVDPWRLADELEQPPSALATAPHAGRQPNTGSLVGIPAGYRLLALKPALDGRGWILRLHAVGRRAGAVRIQWLGTTVALGSLRRGRIGTWRLAQTADRWAAEPTNAAEEPPALIAGAAARRPVSHPFQVRIP